MINWYEKSIKSFVEDFFKINGFNINFDTSDFWDTSMNKWRKNILPSQRIKFDKIARMARSLAFDKKYGTYLYENDYRSACENWNNIIFNEIQDILGYNLAAKNVLAVGSNNGSELEIIFGLFFASMKIDIVEISKTACKKGKTFYPHINFYCASMDEFVPCNNKYDIYINLRAAYCAGNNLDIIVRKAVNAIKPGGIIIFSISNGKNIPIKGIYNPENNHCDETETSRNINWMKTAMLANGCSNVKLVDAQSEILLISVF